MADAAKKLLEVLKPSLDDMAKGININTTAASQEVLLAVGNLEKRLDILEKVMSEKKKAPVRAAKPTEGGAAEPNAEGAADGANGAAAEPKPITVQNKLAYFRAKFKAEPEFREKYSTAELKTAMDSDAVINGKTNAEQKLNAQQSFCWNFIKSGKDEALTKMYNDEFEAAKRAAEAKNKPAQQETEANTPPK